MFVERYYASELRPPTTSPRRHVSLEAWWNHTNKGKPKNLKKNLSQCHFVNHESHTDWCGHEPTPPKWDADD